MAQGRLRHTLRWIEAFCRVSERGLVTRVTLSPGAWAQGFSMFVDASPWGGGAFLSLQGAPVAWLSTAWSPSDEAHLGLRIGDHRDQALVELLIVVVAAKAWTTTWGQTPTVLTTRSDRIAALGALERARRHAAQR